MVQAYRADPKTRGVWALFTNEEWELMLVLSLRGIRPGELRNAKTKDLIKGLEFVYENLPPGVQEEGVKPA